MPIPKSILERIETFRRNLDSYIDPEYKEARVRQEFIDPLFTALGWDMDNTQGYAEAYKDVVHEDSLRISGVGATAPDYSFRIGGTRKFFVEAKKPSVHLKDDPEPALQLRRYSWSDKLSLGIVTDFQEFAIYDTRIRPKEGDKASIARIFYCTYEEFPGKWDEIAGIFSREAVLKGSFDKYSATNKGKRGTTEFDDDFLRDMEHWRELLARNLALRNAGLTERELNFAVQRILDRIVFLRIAEDRGIEPYGQLLALTAGSKIYPRLAEIFERADFRYNSGLFHFATEKGRDESPDKLTLRLALDDGPLKEIISTLYWPKSPYAFAVIPADILGHVYEQFLGKVIHLTPEHHARVEEKPEVRKAGGVYYTPTYIVNYIVQQTVGPLIEGKTPKQVEKIKVLDPACGSGSFLIGAYDFLLDWHLRYYLDHDPEAWAKKKNPPIYESAPNAHGVGQGSKNWLLTTAERKRILVANLHGVDIDAQAVEVTKLSLLLKVLEGEARELRGKQVDFHRVLPDLGNNIKCGNSLIGSDFYQQPELPDFDDEARIKINAFDWAHEFKTIMDASGFDAVIGNPPYGATMSAEEIDYCSLRHSAAAKYPDSYCIFMLAAIDLLKSGGILSYIVPNTFCDLEGCDQFRRWLLRTYIVKSIWESGWAFDQAVVDTLVFTLEKVKPTRSHSILVEAKGRSYKRAALDFLSSELSKIVYRNTTDEHRFISKLERDCSPFRVHAIINAGVKMYERGKGSPPQTEKTLVERPYSTRSSKPSGWKTLYRGECVQRYRFSDPGEFVTYGPWLAAPRSAELFVSPKLLMRRTDDRLMCSVESSNAIAVNSCHVIKLRSEEASYSFFAGLLNSRLMQFAFELQNPQMVGKVFAEIKVIYVERLPIPKLDFQSSVHRSKHDALVVHVERMLQLHADLAAAKSPDAQTHLQRDIAATDRAIDQLVYQLYGLTAEEIALVEATATPATAKEP